MTGLQAAVVGSRDLREQLALLEAGLEAAQGRIGELELGLVTAQARIAHLEEENATLRERLGKNSRNSSRPPSTDQPGQRQQGTQRTKGKRVRGGQAGRVGKTRQLLPIEQVDDVVPLLPDDCAYCGASLEDAVACGEPLRHQVTELPPVTPKVIEYQQHQLRCPHCRRVTTASLPAEVAPSRFGARLQSIVGLLRGRFRLSHRDIPELMEVLFGVDMGLGTTTGIQRRLTAALDKPYEEATLHIRGAPCRHADETGWTEQHKSRWLWLMATHAVAVFQIQGGRGKVQAQELLGTEGGQTVTDRYAAYHWLPDANHQFCWAHLLRDFQAMIERGGSSAWYGDRLRSAAGRILDAWTDWSSGRLTRAQLLDQVAQDKARIERFLTLAAAAPAAGKTRRVCAEILKHESCLWVFLAHDHVPPTNNLAERLLRHAVLWRKACFGTDSPDGSRFTERILTLVASLRLQGRARSTLDTLTEAYLAQLRGTAHPSLLPVLAATR